MAAQCCGAALVAGDFIEQPLEFLDVAVDRLLEVAVGAILAADFIEGLLAGWRVQALAEGLGLAALVACLAHDACFYDADGTRGVTVFPHVISSLGHYLARDGAKVSVFDLDPGEGTTVTIMWPASDDDDPLVAHDGVDARADGSEVAS